MFEKTSSDATENETKSNPLVDSMVSYNQKAAFKALTYIY